MTSSGTLLTNTATADERRDWAGKELCKNSSEYHAKIACSTRTQTVQAHMQYVTARNSSSSPFVRGRSCTCHNCRKASREFCRSRRTATGSSTSSVEMARDLANPYKPHGLPKHYWPLSITYYASFLFYTRSLAGSIAPPSIIFPKRTQVKSTPEATQSYPRRTPYGIFLHLVLQTWDRVTRKPIYATAYVCRVLAVSPVNLTPDAEFSHLARVVAVLICRTTSV
ncbi:hypothetical protein F4776DRAFT_383342 [Hypoxylon sp. NC0597]|nr:hypothetical protein F4776DRAFT_383342 [Hypoxylon sp. NC0597]